MESSINNVLDYTPPPSEKDFNRWRRVLWLSAAISFGMALGGYAIMVYFVLK
jgi:hypothetical protein